MKILNSLLRFLIFLCQNWFCTTKRIKVRDDVISFLSSSTIYILKYRSPFRRCHHFPSQIACSPSQERGLANWNRAVTCSERATWEVWYRMHEPALTCEPEKCRIVHWHVRSVQFFWTSSGIYRDIYSNNCWNFLLTTSIFKNNSSIKIILLSILCKLKDPQDLPL